MNLINLSSFKKAQITLRVNALFLFLFVIFTPYLVKTGTWGVSEPVVEGLFLALEIIILIKLFKNYDFHSNRNDRKASKLKNQLREQQELLTDSLEYLGKMNVQMSIVKQVVNKLKSPVDKNRLDYVISEMLQLANGLVGSENTVLKIVDLKNQQTIKKFFLGKNNNFKKSVKKIFNGDLCKYKKTKKEQLIKKNARVHIISSSYDNFSLGTFAIFDLGREDEDKKKKVKSEQLELVQDIVNQCEVIFLLANSKYYKK